MIFFFFNGCCAIERTQFSGRELRLPVFPARFPYSSSRIPVSWGDRDFGTASRALPCFSLKAAELGERSASFPGDSAEQTGFPCCPVSGKLKAGCQLQLPAVRKHLLPLPPPPRTGCCGVMGFFFIKTYGFCGFCPGKLACEHLVLALSR